MILPRPRTAFLAAIALILLTRTALAQVTVEPFQPDIPAGGRAVAATSNSLDDSKLVVASYTGGLFRSLNGGTSWRHLDRFPSFRPTDVEYAPGSSYLLIATASADTRAINGGGMWRSEDDGATWTRPETAQLPATERCTPRANANAVSFSPEARVVYAATDCGVAVSDDLGVSWRHLVLEPGSRVDGQKLQDRAWSVAAAPGGKVYTGTRGTLWHSEDHGNTWVRAISDPIDEPGYIQSLAVSPLNADHAFAAFVGQDSGYRVFATTDGGLNWTGMPVPGRGPREPFVKTALSTAGGDSAFDLYYGSGIDVYRKRCLSRPTGFTCDTDWTRLSTDHSDPNDIAFDSEGRNPILLLTDGGVHRFDEVDGMWKTIGGGRFGFNALQIYEVTGQQGFPYRSSPVDLGTGWRRPPHTDLYFGTQDNNLHASRDGGTTWLPPTTCCEGFFIQPRRISGGLRDIHAEDLVTYGACSPCGNHVARPHFEGPAGWPNPPGPLIGNPFLIRKLQYLQLSQPGAPEDPRLFLQVTHMGGSSWEPRAEIAQEPRSRPHLSGTPDRPVAYMAYRRPEVSPTVDDNMGLLRVADVVRGTATRPTLADGTSSSPLGVLGRWATDFVYDPVFGVNPQDPNHVIAADVESNQMKYTFDGGLTWLPDAELTRLVTKDGQFRFYDGPVLMQVHVIAFDPDLPNWIFVGTQETGIVYSNDGGRSWNSIAGTEQITNISSFFFDFDHSVIVSSYGRGLWRLRMRPRESVRDPWLPPGVAVDPWVFDAITGAPFRLGDLGIPEVCLTCYYVAVDAGQIRDAEIGRGMTLRRLRISGGTVRAFDSRGQQVRFGVPVTARGRRFCKWGRSEERVFDTLRREGAQVKGLVMDGQKVLQVITSTTDLKLTPRPAGPPAMAETGPYIRTVGVFTIGGMPAIEPDQSISIAGTGFRPCAQAACAVKVFVDETVVAKDVLVDQKGAFRASFPVSGSAGPHRLAVEQMPGQELLRDATTVLLLLNDQKH
jgi:hypothetical protein